MTNRIEAYVGPYDFLSVRYPSPIVVDGILYPTVEHAYCAQRVVGDSRRRAIARATSSSALSALASRSIIRPMWYGMRHRVVEDLLRLKFEIRELREKLFSTDDSVLAGREIDKGVGSNEMMMKIRSELREIYRR